MTNKYYHGDTVLLEIQTGVFAPVQILEVTYKFGNVYYQVTPINGKGEMKVEQSSLKPYKQ